MQKKLIIANAIICSYVGYGTAVWGGTLSENINKLQITLNSTARFILRESKYTSVKTLMEKCKWLSINQRVVFASTMELWKVVRGESSPYWIENLFSQENMRMNRSTTQDRIPHHLRPNLKITRDGWRFRAIETWNMLPENIRTELRMSSFRKKLKEWVKNNIDCVRPQTAYFILKLA